MHPSIKKSPTHKQPFLILVALLLCLLLTACNLAGTSTSNGTSGAGGSSSGANGGTGTTQSGNTSAIGAGEQGVQVFVEPDAGSQVITSAIASAQKSVWLEMYLLTERKIISALEEAAHRGLDVRVMLEVHPYGSGSTSPRQTLDRLKAAGVHAQATSSIFTLTHEKGMVIDGSTAFIMTSNFTLSALGGTAKTKNREYGVIDKNPEDVQGVINIFNADWKNTNAQFNAPNLVVSPENSRPAFLSLINAAQKSLQVEAEEMQDSEIEQALGSAVKRGVSVQVILPAPSGNGGSDSNSEGINVIRQAGVQVKEDTQLYMHAKLFVVDGQKAFVGSENISTASLNHNRELGILLADANAISTLQQTFTQDWSSSQSV